MTEMHSIFARFSSIVLLRHGFFSSSSRSSDQITVEGHITHLSHSLSSTTTSSTIDDEMFNSTDFIWKQMRFWVVVILRIWWTGMPFTMWMLSTFCASNFNLLKMTFIKRLMQQKRFEILKIKENLITSGWLDAIRWMDILNWKNRPFQINWHFMVYWENFCLFFTSIWECIRYILQTNIFNISPYSLWSIKQNSIQYQNKKFIYNRQNYKWW